MGISFIKRMKVLPGFNLIFSTRGVSASAGPEGVKIVKKLTGKGTRLYAQKYGVRYFKSLEGKKGKPKKKNPKRLKLKTSSKNRKQKLKTKR
ncbi:MAG: DUF4236 domain-containing protein [Candidatus ainarchaeum sp.]|nr:DUF4236 domain-containing protein [Candidatus ainarchaeum sp.]